MGCLIERDKNGRIVRVLGPNGKPSLLYEQIKRNIPDDYEPDVFVRTAFKAGLVRSLTSKDEIALALWGKVHTPFEEAPVKKPVIPAVKPGHVRLYRGEMDMGDHFLPDWLRDLFRMKSGTEGVHFTESLSEARRYNEEYGAADGRISYVDVREGEAARYERQAASGEESAFFLPEDMAAQREVFVDGPGLKDANGEPIFAALREQLGLGSNMSIHPKINAEALLRFLRREKLIYKDGDRYLVSKEATLQYGGKNGMEQNAKRIEALVEQLGLDEGAVVLEGKVKSQKLKAKSGENNRTRNKEQGIGEGKDGEIEVKVDPRKMRVMGNGERGTERERGEGEGGTNTKRLVRFLKERFPQLEIGFVTEKKARAIYGELQSLQPANRRFKIDFNQVKSFVYQGKVHLIEGRVDDGVVVEEVLHPFVYTVSKENPKLFEELVAEAKKSFPAVYQRIQNLYTDKAGFTAYDREQELVAQVLSELFTKEHAEHVPASIRPLLEQFKEWFAQLVRDFAAFIGGKNQVVIDSGRLDEGMKLTDIARMLNTFDSQFLVDIKAPEINFRISPAHEAFLQRVKSQGNELQKKVVNDVLHPKDPVTLIEKDHTYESRLKRVFRSMTTAINGKFDDPDGKWELNRLFGNALDKILESLVMNEAYEDIKDEIKLKVLDQEIAQKAYRELRSWLQALKRDGTIALPQVVVADAASGIAGSIDVLLVHTDGTMTVIDLKTSKKSVGDPGYRTTKIPVGEGSKLDGEPLSKAQRHGIQIGGYKRLLEVMGHTVVGTQTYHIHLDIEGKEKNQVVKTFQMEDFEDHDPMDVEVFVKRIIDTEPKVDKLRGFRKELRMDNPALDDLTEDTKRSKEYRDALDQLRVKVEGFREGLEKRIDRLDKVKSIASFKPARQAKQKLSELLMFMSEDLSRNRADLAYGQFLTRATEEVGGLIDYLTNPAKKGTDEFIERVLDAHTYLETYRGMVNSSKWALGSYPQRERLRGLQDLLDQAQDEVKLALKDYVLRMMKMNTSKAGLTEEDWRKLLKEGVDISKADKYLGDIDTSTDELVAVAAKVYKLAKLRAVTRGENFKEKLRAIGNRLSVAFGGNPDFDMILDYDENGKFTGRYIQRIGIQFWRMYKSLQAPVVDADGRMLKYRKVYSKVGGKAEDIEYNKQLYAKKKAWYKFTEAENTEVLDEKGMPTKGNFFEYKQEFINERNKYEEFKDGRWVKRASIGWKEFKLYELKYYDKLNGYDKPFVMNEEFTGTLVRNAGNARFVKQQHKEVREITGDKKDMRSEKYVRLMTGTDERTKAMRAFYDFYVKAMEEALAELPMSVQRDMMGKVGRVRGQYIKRAMRGPEFFKLVAKDAKDWFKVRTSTRQSMFDAEGNLVNQIPLFYTGGFRNEKRITDLEQKIEQLNQDLEAKKIKKADFMDQRKKLVEELQMAENALDPNEVQRDLVKNLESFYDMAASFGEMQRLESSLLAVQKVLEDRIYKRKTSSGEVLKDKDDNEVGFKAEESRTVERFKAWMQMTFYSSEELDRNTWEVVAKRLMNLSSTLNVGFNAFGPIHNYLMARINTAIETFGGLFYTKEAGTRAMGDFNTEFLPGFVRNFTAMEGEYYKTKRLGSKYEALVKHFHMIREQRLGEGKPKESVLNFFTYGYTGQSMGEYAAQSKSGIAYLMSQKIKDKNGNELSIYDAYEFDEDSQTLKLKEGFENFAKDENKKHGITNSIWEMNKQIHGSYAWEDRAMIQKEVLGQMAMQFHKWVYPMYKARFQGHYVDENLGDIEGRYRTVANLILLFKRAEGDFMERARSAFKGMRPDQIRNMYRNAAELGFFASCFIAYGLFKSLADGVDDDDKYLKRCINFFTWESSRDWKEILFWFPVAGSKEQFDMIKNPFAAGTTVTQFSDVLYELARLPIPPYDDAYYERGPFKGDLKLGKEFRDLVPIFKELNRWATFDNVTSFHIK